MTKWTVVLSLLNLSVCLAQNELKLNTTFQKQKDKKYNENYIEDLSDKLLIKANRDTRNETYTFVTDGISTTFRPNNVENYSASIDYKFIGFSIGVPKKWYENDVENYLKGKTKTLNLNLSVFVNKWMQTFNYNTVKGFYLVESPLYIANFQNGITPYIQLPNHKERRFGGSTSYIFNGDKFSYRSFSQQTQIQKKSAGSLIPTLSYEYFYLTDSDELRYSYEKTFTLMASIGYQYNWIFLKNCNLSGGIASGYGASFGKTFLSDQNSTEMVWTPKFSVNLNLNLSYKWRNLICGIQLASLNRISNENKSLINNAINYQNIYLGYLFDAPKIIKKPVRWAEKKLF